ncbi:MAG: hypothetical protein U0269_06040 [Polyangiales bacterium]
MAVDSKRSAPSGQRTLRASPDVVESTLWGRVDGAVLRELEQDATRCGWAATWLIDALEVSGFTPDSVTSGVRVLESGRARGLKRIVIVTTLPAARMAARTIGLSASVELHVADSRAAADELIRRPLR